MRSSQAHRADSALIDTPTYWVPALESSWAARMDAACRAIETRFGIRISEATGGTKFHVTRNEVPDRLKFFAQRLKTRNRGFGIRNAGAKWRRTKRGVENVDDFGLGGSMYAGLDVFKLSAHFPAQPVAVHEQLMVELGDALEAYSAQITPTDAAMRLRQAHWFFQLSALHRHPLENPLPEETRLPPILESAYTGLTHPCQPHHLGWINYWSEEVCGYLGFPENLRDSPFLSDCYRTPRGAWIVKFGSEPFEARNPKHVDLLREMYERFPRAGVRLDSERARTATPWVPHTFG
jgi:hypothetical protein